MSSVRVDTGRTTIAVRPGRCADDHLGCPCKGNRSIHEARSAEIAAAQPPTAEIVGCPECGEATTPMRLVSWGHCRTCHTADSRAIRPLRW